MRTNTCTLRICGGYTFIRMPLHPMSNASGYMAYHRIVMERHLWRYLGKAEVVHHVNGNKQDTRKYKELGLSYRDISEKLNIPYGTVYDLLNNKRKIGGKNGVKIEKH